MVFAIPNGADGKPDNAGVGGGGVAYIFVQAMGSQLGGLVLFISAVGAVLLRHVVHDLGVAG